MTRSRWAAIGAAITVSLAGGGYHLAQATISSGSRNVYTPIAPCRLFDTRPAPSNVGPRNTPLTAAETVTFQVTGSNGNCTIPTDVVAVVMNVTGVSPTMQTYITIYPADLVARPTASNLNLAAGQAPTPNLVTATLSPAGAVKVYNNAGTINLIADITGYYTDHTHDDRYYTEAETDVRSKWISIDPLAVNLRSGATVETGFGINGGLMLPGGDMDLPAFEFGFALPPDYTPGTDVTVELLWHINQTACTVNLSSNYASIDHYGAVPSGSTFGYRVADPVPSTPNQVARTTFTVRNASLVAGDSVIVGLFRSYNSDTCSQPLHIKGIRILYD